MKLKSKRKIKQALIILSKERKTPLICRTSFAEYQGQRVMRFEVLSLSQRKTYRWKCLSVLAVLYFIVFHDHVKLSDKISKEVKFKSSGGNYLPIT